MFRKVTILILSVLLLAQMASPLCHAMAAASAGSIAEAGTDVVVVAGEESMAAASDEPEHICWFKTAHIFNHVWIPAAVELPTQYAEASLLEAASLVPEESTMHVELWEVPDRAPPGQPLLQVFRI